MLLDGFIFYDNLPKLDLHGFDRDSARCAINDFISDNIKMGNKVVNIIHGKGSGIIREATISTLRSNRNVLEFKSSYFNSGCTLVRIKI